MPTQSEWAGGFLAQAREDWNAWHIVRKGAAFAASTHLHLLQMATEKLAKAMLISGG